MFLKWPGVSSASEMSPLGEKTRSVLSVLVPPWANSRSVIEPPEPSPPPSVTDTSPAVISAAPSIACTP